MEKNHERDRPPSTKTLVFVGTVTLLVTGLVAWGVYRATHQQPAEEQGPAHHDITATVFWVGEDASKDNAQIHNRSSTWLADWEGAFGGMDDPDDRCDLLPCDFAPRENAFYFALPYSDLDESCGAKPSQKDVPWYDPGNPPAQGHSIIKNRWIEVVHNNKTAYAQWEDAGPFGEDDTAYVFGDAQPQSDAAGLDLSPAAAEYLGIDGKGQTSWQFVAEHEVPDGPWKQTVTTSAPDCAK